MAAAATVAVAVAALDATQCSTNGWVIKMLSYVNDKHNARAELRYPPPDMSLILLDWEGDREGEREREREERGLFLHAN